jgi:hypothetical protein
MSTKEYEQAKKDNCSVRKLTVEDGPVSKNFTLRFCLAAEVINGTLSVAIEECSRYYQSFNISVDRGTVRLIFFYIISSCEPIPLTHRQPNKFEKDEI